MPQIYQRTLNGIDMKLDELEDMKASMQNKFIENQNFWRKMIKQDQDRIR